jgi:GTPase SAR1 family protein
VKTRDLEELCSEIQKYKELDLLKWYYTSAKTGVNVNDAFESLAKKLVI